MDRYRAVGPLLATTPEPTLLSYLVLSDSMVLIEIIMGDHRVFLAEHT